MLREGCAAGMLKHHMYILKSLLYLKKKEEREGVDWMSSSISFSNQVMYWSETDYNIQNLNQLLLGYIY